MQQSAVDVRCGVAGFVQVESYKEKVEALAKKLLEVETVSHDLIVNILGERPFANDQYKVGVSCLLFPHLLNFVFSGLYEAPGSSA